MAAKEKQHTVERRMKILNLLIANDQVFVSDLSKEFGVSEVTIRNDLAHMEDKKLLIRARGGAMRVDHVVSLDQHLAEKSRLHAEQKNRIGKAAARLIKDGDTVIIDSGTTTMEIIKNLPPAISNLTVITNALNIANNLIANDNITLIIPGGSLRRKSRSLVGPLAEKNLRNFFVDKVFLGADSFDTRHGISTPNLDEASLNQVMIEIAREVVVVTDSSKFLRRSLTFICKTSNIHTVVTDTGISGDDKKRLEDAGIKVIAV